jgi:hypothetical protein
MKKSRSTGLVNQDSKSQYKKGFLNHFDLCFSYEIDLPPESGKRTIF